jgi:hypothetical protein
MASRVPPKKAKSLDSHKEELGGHAQNEDGPFILGCQRPISKSTSSSTHSTP